MYNTHAEEHQLNILLHLSDTWKHVDYFITMTWQIVASTCK